MDNIFIDIIIIHTKKFMLIIWDSVKRPILDQPILDQKIFGLIAKFQKLYDVFIMMELWITSMNSHMYDKVTKYIWVRL